MKITHLFVFSLLMQIASGAPRPHAEHDLEGPYDYNEHGKAQPRFYTLDGTPYYSMKTLKSRIAQLPSGSTVFWHGGCQPYDRVELGPRPYMSLTAFRSFCKDHHVSFDWYFGR